MGEIRCWRRKEEQLILNGDALKQLQKLPDKSIHCCVTSPPYYGLRDYGVDGQIGLESTPEEFIEKLVVVFREVRRVMRDDGTLWVNIGDSYAGNGKRGGGDPTIGVRNVGQPYPPKSTPQNCKPKDLLGIPWMLAFALRADGWYLRQDIIWAKPNPMPESVRDRCTKSHEYIFLLSKSSKYFYDAEAIKEPCVQDEMANGFRGGAYCGNETFDNEKGGRRKTKGNYRIPAGWDVKDGSHGTIHRDGRTRYGGKKYTENPDAFCRTKSGDIYRPSGTRNKRDVWTVATQGFSEAHFATFPPELIRPCVRAGCPKGGVVIDPFFGSGTTGSVSVEEGREFIGIELNAEYIEISKRRLKQVQIKMI